VSENSELKKKIQELLGSIQDREKDLKQAKDKLVNISDLYRQQ